MAAELRRRGGSGERDGGDERSLQGRVGNHAGRKQPGQEGRVAPRSDDESIEGVGRAAGDRAVKLEEHLAQPAVDLIELRAAFRQQKSSLKIADPFRQGRTGQTDVPGDDLPADKGHASWLVE